MSIREKKKLKENEQKCQTSLHDYVHIKKKGKKPQENEQKTKTNQSKPNQTKLKKPKL